MHVAICSDGVFPEAIGGMQRHTRLLVETIAKFHPEIRLTVIHTHPGKRLFEATPGVEEIALAPRPGKRQYILECLELSERFADTLRRMPEAVIYSQGICVVRNIREFTHRLVVNPHGLESFQTLTLRDWAITTPFRTVQKRTFRHGGRVISLGGKLTDILRRQCHRDPGKVVVIPNGVVVPETPSRALRHPGDPLRLIFVGRLVWNKGVPDLLAAMDELARRGAAHRFELDLVGNGPLLDDLRRTPRQSTVRFHDKVSDGELEALYSHADALVLPTLFEGMPTVVLEAMARGLPALVTDVGASRELVDSSNGEIIPKRDPNALADALLRLESMGTSGRDALGSAGRQRTVERFTWKAVAQAHVRLFAEVNESRSTVPAN
jgi:glycosyltransferase involved in cell wall biosynthesis